MGSGSLKLLLWKSVKTSQSAANAGQMANIEEAPPIRMALPSLADVRNKRFTDGAGARITEAQDLDWRTLEQGVVVIDSISGIVIARNFGTGGAATNQPRAERSGVSRAAPPWVDFISTF